MAQATASRPSDDRLLAAYAESPTPSSLEALVERYRPLAHSLANRYRRRSEPLDDLLQVADLGLIKAIRGFDPTRQAGFAAYAVPTILGELRRHFRDKVWDLRLPRSLQESSMTVERSIEHLSGQLGRSPTVRELASESGYSIEDINETLVARDTRWAASMDAPVGCDDGESPMEVEEFVVLDDGVVLAVVNQEGRPVGADGQVHQREGWAICWSADGLLVRVTTNTDIDEVRAAAERGAHW